MRPAGPRLVGRLGGWDVLLRVVLCDLVGRDGLFPELTFFDCHACHHPMSNVRWEPRATVGLPPLYVMAVVCGTIRMNVVSFFVIGSVGRLIHFAAVAVLPQYAKSWLS